jgi:pimeloyl-ACP methyl ester carboxylesterase
MNKALTWLVFIVSLNSTLVTARDIQNDVIMETSKGKLVGALTIPENFSGDMVALIISGSGPTDRDGNAPNLNNNSLSLLAEGLAKEGIASLRYDKRGVGKSANAGIQEADLRFEHYVQDSVDWIEWLVKDKRFNDIVVIGHSEGALIGMLAAQQAKASKYISISGSSLTGGALLKEQLASQPEAVKGIAFPIIDQLTKGSFATDVDPAFNALFRESVQPYLISWFKYDPLKEMSKLTMPVLIIHGSTDIQINVGAAKALASENQMSELSIIKGMNHVLKEVDKDQTRNLQTYNSPDMPLHPQLIESILHFITDN